MEDVKYQMQRVKKNSSELEAELRGTRPLLSFIILILMMKIRRGLATADAEQKARLLGSKATENQETIQQLRQERSMLASDHKALQRRYAEASEVRFSLP